MRQITRESRNAFLNGQNFNKQNMFVSHENGKSKMFLHGNLIAKIENGKLYISSAGWQTANTKERLNSLPGVSIQQKNFVWYLNGSEWVNSSKFFHVCNID